MHKNAIKILDYITQYIEAHGYAPTIREIAEGCGFRSTSTVAYHLNALEGAGLITRRYHTPRAIVLQHPVNPVNPVGDLP